MLLRRMTQHIKEQNWIAVGIDLVVVIVGIFLAFQLERLYETRRIQSQEGQHLQSLLSDFQEEKEYLEWMIDRYATAKAAVDELIRLSPEDAEQLSNNEFYELVAESQRMGSVEPRRRTYDTLVATGAIESLTDEVLQTELGAYFAFVESHSDARSNWTGQLNMLWEPFVLKNLDRNMIIRYSHPNDKDMLDPVHDEDRFREVVGSDSFRNVMGKRWHFYRDRGAGLVEMKERMEAIEDRLVENLRRFQTEIQ
jgi:hypothetical protein